MTHFASYTYACTDGAAYKRKNGFNCVQSGTDEGMHLLMLVGGRGGVAGSGYSRQVFIE